jgi:hypothetical protein
MIVVCISPTYVGVIPAKYTGAEAVPTVAVAVRVSLDSGLFGAAAPEGIALSSGPLPII